MKIHRPVLFVIACGLALLGASCVSPTQPTAQPAVQPPVAPAQPVDQAPLAAVHQTIAALGISYVSVADGIQTDLKGNRLEATNDPTEFLEGVPRPAGNSLKDAVQTFALANGFHASSCTLNVAQVGDTPADFEGPREWTARLVPIDPNWLPTQTEIYAALRAQTADQEMVPKDFSHMTDAQIDTACNGDVHGDCLEAESNLVLTHQISECGPYVADRENEFLTDSADSAAIVFVHNSIGFSTGLAQAFYEGGSIEFLTEPTADLEPTTFVNPYVNTDYGFQVKLPANFVGYKVSVNKTSESQGAVYVHFLLPTTDQDYQDGLNPEVNTYGIRGYDEVMGLRLMKLADWNALVSQCAKTMQPGCSSENDVLAKIGGWAFDFTDIQSGASDLGPVVESIHASWFKQNIKAYP